MEEESSSCSRNSEEVLGAAQQLMQLSNDDDSSSINVVTAERMNKKNKKLKKDHGGEKEEEEEVDQKRCQIETSIWLKIEEIFGKDDDEDCGSICRPKKRRFRSIQSIYMKTKPIVNGRFSGKGILGT